MTMLLKAMGSDERRNCDLVHAVGVPPNLAKVRPNPNRPRARSNCAGHRWRTVPDTRPQAQLDKRVITAVSALTHKHWPAPHMYGSNRDRWKLPDAD